MARKKVNKKLAIIGSIIIVLMLMAAIVVMLKLSKNPQKSISDAKAALANNDYEEALQHFGKALGGAKQKNNIDLQIEIYFMLVDVHSAQNEYHDADWMKTAACWHNVINLDPKNIEARQALLDFFYEGATSGSRNLWSNVETHSMELKKVLTEKGKPVFPYITKAEGEAKLNIARMGQTSDVEGKLQEAIELLEGLREQTPDDYEIYELLMEAALAQGNIESSKGIIDAYDKAIQNALNILELAKETMPNNARAHTQYLRLKLEQAGTDKDEIEAEFKSLREKFSDQADVYAASSNFYQIRKSDMDTAIKMALKARELDPENIKYSMLLTNLYHRQYLFNKNPDSLEKSINLCLETLNHPDAIEVTGPRSFANKVNRLNLFTVLLSNYIQEALYYEQAGKTSEKNSVISKTEDAVSQLEQLYGSGDNLYVRQWQGMLEMIKGNELEAIRLMYNTYTQLKAVSDETTDTSLPVLAYMLSKVFKDKPEVGLRAELLSTVLRNRRLWQSFVDPDVILDTAEVALQLKEWNAPIRLVDNYESVLQSTPRSQKILIKALIGGGDFEKAQEKLNEFSGSDKEKLILKLSFYLGKFNQLYTEKAKAVASSEMNSKPAALSAEKQEQLNAVIAQLALLFEQALQYQPEELSPSSIISISAYYLSEGRLSDAIRICDQYLKYSPDDVTIQIYRLQLKEPDSTNISPERNAEIVLSVYNEIEDPVKRNMLLGQFYMIQGNSEKSHESYLEAYRNDSSDYNVVTNVFDSAIRNDDMDMAKKIADNVRKENIDGCNGNLFLSQIDIKNSDYENALKRINECIEMRPTMHTLYTVRSQINQKLGNQSDALADIKTSVTMNPTDAKSIRVYAMMLYERNEKLGNRVTPDQYDETLRSLLRAIQTNKNDTSLLSIYAEYIKDKEPQQALAIRQNLYRGYPTLQNALLLGRMAMELSHSPRLLSQKDALIEIADSSFEEAYEMAPDNEAAVSSYAEFLRQSGRQQEAEKLFGKQKDVLWKIYLRDGNYEKAHETLKELYSQDPKNVEILKGLMVTSRGLRNNDELKRFSEELIKTDNSETNQLLQIEGYLNSGLVDEAEQKLASFRERYPNNETGLLMEAYGTVRKGQLEKGLELTNRYLERQPENPMAWRLRGEVNSLLGDFNKAVEAFEESKAIMPAPETQLSLARAYIRANRTLEAIGELNDALSSDQAPPAARDLLENVYLRNNMTKDLKRFYNETLKKFPESSRWHLKAANFYNKLKDIKTATQLAKQGFELSLSSGGDIHALDFYLDLLRTSGQIQEFYDLAAKYVDTDFAIAAYTQMAQEKAQSGSRTSAKEYYFKALERSSQNETYMFNILGIMNKDLGPREVARWCTQKLESNPDSIAANMTMYHLLTEKEDYNKAVSYLDNCIKQVETNSKAWGSYMSRKANTLLMAYMKTGDKQYLRSGISLFDEILDVQPENLSALNNLAFLLADNNERIDDAFNYATKAHEVSPNQPVYMDTLAYTMIKKKDYKKAEELLMRAIQTFEEQNTPIPWDTYEHLGMAQEGLERKQDALQSYQKAKETAGTSLSEVSKEKLETAIQRVSR